MSLTLLLLIVSSCETYTSSDRVSHKTVFLSISVSLFSVTETVPCIFVPVQKIYETLVSAFVLIGCFLYEITFMNVSLLIIFVS